MTTKLSFLAVIYDTKGKEVKEFVVLAEDWSEANQVLAHWFARGDRWMRYSGYKLTKKEK
jgi:hypothetical protein